MSTTTLKFVKFTENNEWEGEIFTTWLQVNGNEAQLDKLHELLINADPDEDDDFPYSLYLSDSELLSEEYVDVLVEHAEHMKVVGTLVCPESLGDNCELIYKNQINKLFTADTSEVGGA